MILVIDLGNTNIVFGLYRGKKLVKQWRFSVYAFKFPKIKSSISSIIVSSVVPSLSSKLKKGLKKHYGISAYFVTAKNVSGIKVKLKNKAEIGADRVVNALAAYALYKGPIIIVDFGTATTFDLISTKGEYVGGAIAPGINLARNALYEHAAKLPKVKIKAPKNVIGKNTVLAMQSGLVFGYVSMVEGMVQKIKQQKTKTIKVVATGGLAPLICKYTRVVDTIDTELTLKGLRIIGEENVRRIK